MMHCVKEDQCWVSRPFDPKEVNFKLQQKDKNRQIEPKSDDLQQRLGDMRCLQELLKQTC